MVTRGRVSEAGRSVCSSGDNKFVAGRSQSAHSSVEASVMDVEPRERRKVDSQSEDKGTVTRASV